MTGGCAHCLGIGLCAACDSRWGVPMEVLAETDPEIAARADVALADLRRRGLVCEMPPEDGV